MSYKRGSEKMKKWYSLIDKIYQKDNLIRASKQVRRNHGAPGIDGETVEAYMESLEENIEFLFQTLSTHSYKASPVKRVEIDKPDGGVRLLGVPTVKDRVVQKALVNILQLIFDPQFHPSSYGYRPDKSQHMALAKAELFLKHGLSHVVDMDLSKCFDTLDHQIMMDEISKTISDGSVLNLIQQFLKSGVMKDGVFKSSEIGSPQGGVISPLLSNIYLNIFDQKMMAKKIRIVRYADDILIFAKTKRDAGNLKTLATSILEDGLKLTVNKKKTKLSSHREGVAFLGVVMYPKFTRVDPKNIKRFKDKVREITKRNNGVPLVKTIGILNSYLRGWINYYCVANIKTLVKREMSWIRRRLRMKRMNQWKTWKAMHKEMRRQGFGEGNGERMAVTKWKNSTVQIIHVLMPNQYFYDLGLIKLENYEVGLLSTKYNG